jgi:hypothetical protein
VGPHVGTTHPYTPPSEGTHLRRNGAPHSGMKNSLEEMIDSRNSFGFGGLNSDSQCSIGFVSDSLFLFITDRPEFLLEDQNVGADRIANFLPRGEPSGFLAIFG